MNSIVLKSINVEYDGRKILDDLNFQFNRGNLYIIRGESGAGKSTLLSIIGLLDKPDSGEVLFDNKKVTNIEEFTASHMSYVFQDDNLLENLSVKENLELVSDNMNKAKELLKEFNVLSKYDRLVNTLSKGEKQRIILVRTILDDKTVLLLDEPVGNLDDKNSELIMQVLKEYCKDHIVIMTMHNNIDLSSYNPLILNLSEGKIKCDNGRENIINDANVNIEKKKRKLPFKVIWSLIRNVLKRNILKTIVLALSFFACSFVLCFSGGSLQYNLNDQLVDIALNSEKEYLTTYVNQENPYQYRIFNATYNDTSFKCLFNKLNRVYVEGNYVVLNDDTLYLSKKTMESLSLHESDRISFFNISNLNIKNITSDYNFISYDLIKEIVKREKHIMNDKGMQNQLTILDDRFKYFNINSFTSVSTINEADKDTNLELKDDEISIFLNPSDYYIGEVTQLMINQMNNNAKGNVLSISKNNDISLGGIKNFNIANVYKSKGNASYGSFIVLSDSLYEKIIDKFYKLENGLSNYIDTEYRLFKEGFKSYDFTRDTYSIISLLNTGNSDIGNTFTMKSIVDKISIGLLIFVSVLIIIYIFLYVYGISRTLKNDKLVLYSLGYNRKEYSSIQVLSSAIISIVPFALGTIIYSLLSKPMTKAFYSNFYAPDIFILSELNSWYIVVINILFTLALLLVSSLYKTRKKMDKLALSMKKNIE